MDAGTDWVASALGQSLDFDGTNDYAILNKDWTTLQRFTCCAWFYYRSGSPTAVFGATNAGLTRANFYLRPGVNSGFTQGGGSFFETPFPSVTANVWSFVAMSYDGATLRHWLNGVNAASSVSAVTIDTDSTMRFCIGRLGNFNGQYANGIIGEVSLFSKALTHSEHNQLYRSGNGWIGRELTGMNRRRRYGKSPVNRRRRFLLGAAS